MVTTCAVPGCSNRFVKKRYGCTFHRFPKNDVRRLAWSKAMRFQGFVVKDSSVICSEHFEEHMFDRTGQTTRLRDIAIPTIFPTFEETPSKGKQISLREQHQKKKSVSTVLIVPQKQCLYVGCNSTNANNDGEKIFFVNVPSAKCNAAKRRQWLELCGRSDLKGMSFTDKFKYYVCWKHFVGGNGPTADYQDPLPYTDKNQMEMTGDDDNQYENGSMILPDNVPQILRDGEYYPVKVECLDVDEDTPASDENDTDDRRTSIQTVSEGTSAESYESPTNPYMSLNEKTKGQYSILPVSESRSTEPKECPPHHYIITVKELSTNSFSLNDIRPNYLVPEDWTLCVTSSTIFFSKVNEATDRLWIKFIINEDLTTRVQVFGEDLKETHQLFQTFPKIISSVESLNQCFLVLNDYNPCCGISEQAFISLYIQRTKSVRCVLNPRTESLHSLTCHVLTNSKVGLCLSCQVLRGVLIAKLECFFENFENKFND